MAATWSEAVFRQLDAYELELCLRANRACRIHPIERFFGLVSRLGDGAFWYALMLSLPWWHGPEAITVAVRMAAVGAVGVAVYQLLKTRLARQRPFVLHAGIRSATAPLDRYSFPSGHTLHAVSFTTIATTFYPGLAWLLVPFAALVALSRVVLGLHYPSDVLIGAALGGALAWLGLAL